MSFTCDLCKKSLGSLHSLKYHQNNKVCEKFKCALCNKIFTRNESLQYHLANNVCVHSNNVKPSKKLIIKKDFSNQYEGYTKQELLLELVNLKAENRALKENPQNVSNINHQINIIVPPSFLSLDNLSTLTQMFPNLLPDTLSKHPTDFVTFLIGETNCNPKTPQFNSVKITNKKDAYAKISNGKEYIYAPKKQIITQLIENKKSILQEYVDNNGDEYGQKVLKSYQNYMDLLDEDTETLKDLEMKIACMLLNIGHLIGSDDWSKNLLESLKS